MPCVPTRMLGERRRATRMVVGSAASVVIVALGACDCGTSHEVDPSADATVDANDVGSSDANVDAAADANVDAQADAGTGGRCRISAECPQVPPPPEDVPDWFTDPRESVSPSCCRGPCVAVTPLGPCVSGPAPLTCENGGADVCPQNMLCMSNRCGWAECIPDCVTNGDCAAQGLQCEGTTCRFDCRTPGYAGCPDGRTCRANGGCGEPPCAGDSCGPHRVCGPVNVDALGDDGCRARTCMSDADCPDDGGGICVEGICNADLGFCGYEFGSPPPPP